MQVTHQNEHVTHAVIGGKQTIDFGISSSAEFFNILSSTLYSDQILAVVREVLCNAWDTHIEAGYTNVPVQVTLTKDKFVIKDFGKGIHHDDMGPIYGTYGNSTKKNDGNQTGGFGLGCKAPFAYTDHFEVISCHAGTKTIYNLSKSSAQAQGKPGITPIASFPTNETGLQVSIPIKSEKDFARFDALVKRITKHGDMNVFLNGNALPKLEFDAEARPYTIRLKSAMGEVSSYIMVRYGNVIYPVMSSGAIQNNHQRIINFLNTLSGVGTYCIIFQAPAHSISVTPSRESLSMQDHTINTLNKLFDTFLDELDTFFQTACATVVKEQAEQSLADQKPGLLFHRNRTITGGCTHTHKPDLSTLKDMAQQYLSRAYPDNFKFLKEDIKHRLTLLMNAKLLDRGAVHSYLQELDRTHLPYTERRACQAPTSWLQRRVLAPLLSKLQAKGLDTHRLYVCDPHDLRLYAQGGYGQNTLPLVHATKAKPVHPAALIPYLRNIVVLATAKTNMVERAFKHAVFKELGEHHGFLFYHVGMKAKDKTDALEFFKASGMRVVDLTFRQEWEAEPEKRAPVVRKPAKKGAVCLSQLAYSDKRIDTARFHFADATRIEKPEFVVQVSFRTGTYTGELEGFDSQASALIVSLFGDKGAVVNSVASKDSLKAKGAKDMRVYLEEKVCDYLLNSPTIKEYWAFRPSRVAELARGYTARELVGGIYRSKTLRSAFSIVNNLTETDQQYLKLWRALSSNANRYSHSDLVRQTRDALEQIPLDPLNKSFVEGLSSSPLISILDVTALVRLLDDESTPQDVIDKTILVMKTIIS